MKMQPQNINVVSFTDILQFSLRAQDIFHVTPRHQLGGLACPFELCLFWHELTRAPATRNRERETERGGLREEDWERKAERRRLREILPNKGIMSLLSRVVACWLPPHEENMGLGMTCSLSLWLVWKWIYFYISQLDSNMWKLSNLTNEAHSYLDEPMTQEVGQRDPVSSLIAYFACCLLSIECVQYWLYYITIYYINITKPYKIS